MSTQSGREPVHNAARDAKQGQGPDMSGHGPDMSDENGCDINDLAPLLKSLGGRKKTMWEFARASKVPSDDAVRKRADRASDASEFDVKPLSTNIPDGLRAALLDICLEAKGYALKKRLCEVANIKAALALVAADLSTIAEGRARVAVVKAKAAEPKKGTTRPPVGGGKPNRVHHAFHLARDVLVSFVTAMSIAMSMATAVVLLARLQ